MKTAFFAGLAALAAQRVAAHATFQELWVNGVDMGSTCIRTPTSNSPITDVTSNDIRCNANQGAPSYKCVVVAGKTVTVEMHQQPNDRSCSTEAIGGAHYGPVLVYMSKVEDSSSADGSDGWFKVFQDTWSANGTSGSTDNWGTKDLNNNCGKMDVKIPEDLAPGDYLLRAEAIALHAAGSTNGAQFYISCYQLTVTGSGTTNPETVEFPGAYAASDPGILINIYQSLSTYVAPGPDVVSGGSTAVAGQGGSAITATGGSISTITGSGVAAEPTAAPASSAAAASSAAVSSSAAAVTPSAVASSAVASSAAASVVASSPVSEAAATTSAVATSQVPVQSTFVTSAAASSTPSPVPSDEEEDDEDC